MKAIGRNIIIEKKKEGTTRTEGGLLLAENQREDIRYTEATVLSLGEQVEGLKEKDKEILEKTFENNLSFLSEIEMWLKCDVSYFYSTVRIFCSPSRFGTNVSRNLTIPCYLT